MLPSDPWAEEPPLRCRTTSGASSERALQEGLTRMSFLDRIMAAKGSPARRRREAKERERREREGQMDISPLRARAHSQEPARSQRLDEQLETEADVQEEEDGEEEDAVGSLGGGLKSVRWADANTNHRRMTTREHYDLLFHGITPGLEDAAAGSSSTEPANGASAAAPWEETSNMLAWAVSQQQQEQGAGSSLQLLRSGHAANGSPLAQRMHSLAHLPASPDILALDLQGTEACGVRLTPGGFPARRGLLFGPSASPGGYMLSSAGALAAAFAQEGASPGELSAPFPQGPTLARSPARGFPPIGSSSSPARGLRGAASLAAPFGIRESPDRAGLAARGRVASSALQRASGSAAGERRRGPVGWASHSPMRRYDTISPAALFGAPLVPEPDAADESGPSASKAPPAPPAPLPEPTKRRAHKNAATPRVGESDLDGEGDDEWASPEVSIKVSRASSSIRGMPPTSPFDASSQAAVGMDAADRLAGFAATARQERGRNNSYPNDESSPEFGTQRDADAPPRRFVMPASSSSLATALGVPSEERRVRLGSAQPAQRREKSAGASKGKGSKSGGEGEAEASASASGGDGAAPAPRPPGAKKPRNDKKRAAVTPAQAQVGKSEWDRPDGSRIVRLVSEELQAALDAGDVEAPPSRYYKLPPGFGASTGKPSSVSYAGLIGQAILSSSDGKLSLNEVYNWISAVHPFYERGDRGWQNSIRHNLSLNKSFLKVEREANMPGKGGFWAIKPGHEDRFRAGVYIAAPEGKASTPDVAPKSKEPPAKAAAASTASATKPAKELGPDDPEWEAMMPWSKRDPNVPFDAPPGRARNGGGTKERRKRIASNNSAQSEQRSDAEARAPEAAAAAPGSAPGAKRTKAATASGSGSSKKVKLAKARGSPLRPVQTRQSPGPDAANAAEPAAFAESLDMTTPSRPGFSVYASSGHGSTHTNAVPMLTDSASSPPSSPMLEMQAFGNRARAAGAGMLPPSGGASSQSARKRKAARNRGHAQQIPSAAPSLFAPDPMAGHSANGAGNMAGGVPFLGGGMQVSSYNDVGTTFLGNGGYLGSGFTYSHHSLQGSPLAGMQGRLRPGVHGAGMGASFGGSPLRRQNVPPPVPGAGSGASPSRLLSMQHSQQGHGDAGPQSSARLAQRRQPDARLAAASWRRPWHSRRTRGARRGESSRHASADGRRWAGWSRHVFARHGPAAHRRRHARRSHAQPAHEQHGRQQHAARRPLCRHARLDGPAALVLGGAGQRPGQRHLTRSAALHAESRRCGDDELARRPLRLRRRTAARARPGGADGRPRRLDGHGHQPDAHLWLEPDGPLAPAPAAAAAAAARPAARPRLELRRCLVAGRFSFSLFAFCSQLHYSSACRLLSVPHLYCSRPVSACIFVAPPLSASLPLHLTLSRASHLRLASPIHALGHELSAPKSSSQQVEQASGAESVPTRSAQGQGLATGHERPELLLAWPTASATKGTGT
jgi:hypothetical protein